MQLEEKTTKTLNIPFVTTEFQWSDQRLLEFATDNWTKHSHELNPFGAIELTIPNISTVEVLVTVLGRKVMAKVFERFCNLSSATQFAKYKLFSG